MNVVDEILHLLLDVAAGIKNLGAHDVAAYHEKVTPGYTKVEPTADEVAAAEAVLANRKLAQDYAAQQAAASEPAPAAPAPEAPAAAPVAEGSGLFSG